MLLTAIRLLLRCNTISTVRNGDYQVLVRSQEINGSGIHNVDICVAKASESVFPKDKK
jgi:hypothetical protein